MSETNKPKELMYNPIDIARDIVAEFRSHPENTRDHEVNLVAATRQRWDQLNTDDATSRAVCRLFEREVGIDEVTAIRLNGRQADGLALILMEPPLEVDNMERLRTDNVEARTVLTRLMTHDLAYALVRAQGGENQDDVNVWQKRADFYTTCLAKINQRVGDSDQTISKK